MESNELIAKFDGWERVYPGTASRRSRGLAQFDNKDGRHWYCYIEDGIGEGVWPPFATNWNFLMPVIYKIGEIDNQAGIELAARLREKDFLILKLQMRAQIHVAYDAVVEFIKWYNAEVLCESEDDQDDKTKTDLENDPEITDIMNKISEA